VKQSIGECRLYFRVRAHLRSLDSRTRIWACQASEHEPDHGEADKGSHGSCVALIVARQPTIAANPCKCALYDPAFRQDNELVELIALDNFDDPTSGIRGSKSGARALITGIGKDAHNEWKQCPRALVENERSAIAILDVGGVNRDAQQETKRVDEDVPLAACDFLARIVALCIDKSPPFSADLALWLSMMAAVGLASRPACSRSSM